MIASYLIAYLCAVAALAVSFILAFAKGKRGETASYILVGLLAADFLLTLVPAWFESQGSPWFILLAIYNTMGMLLFEGMAESMYEPIMTTATVLQTWEELFLSLYIVTLFICYVATPICLATSAYALLTRKLSEARVYRQVRSYLRRQKDPIYVFSCLNKRSIAFVKSLFSDESGYDSSHIHDPRFNKHVSCVFTSVNQNTHSEYSQIIGEFNSKAIRFYEQNAIDLFERAGSKYVIDANKVFVFFLEEEEDVERLNLGNTISFLEYLARTVEYSSKDCKRYHNGEPCYHIYCACHGESDELALDAVENRKGFDIKVVDECREIIYQLLWSHPLYETTLLSRGKLGLHATESAKRGEFDVSQCEDLDIVIVGSGRYGFEALRACLWMGQIPYVHLHLHVIDKMPWDTFVSRLRHKCPGFFSASRFDPLSEGRLEIDSSGQRLRVSRYFDLRYYAADVTSQDFDNAVALIQHEILSRAACRHKSIDDSLRQSYCIICLGNDDLNMDAAVRLRRLFIGDMRLPVILPSIYVDIYDSRRHDVVKQMSAKGSSAQSVGFELTPFGGMESVFNKEYLIDSEFTSLALGINASYSGLFESEDSPELQRTNFEYFSEWQMNRLSSLTAALSIKTKLWLLGFSLEELSASSTELAKLKQLLAQLEAESRQSWTTDEAGAGGHNVQSTLGLLAKNEHDRWEMFYYGEGWVSMPADIAKEFRTSTGLASLSAGRHDSHLLLQHPYLHDFEKLQAIADEIFGPGQKDPTSSDYQIVLDLGEIVGRATSRRTKETPTRAPFMQEIDSNSQPVSTFAETSDLELSEVV